MPAYFPKPAFPVALAASVMAVFLFSGLAERSGQSSPSQFGMTERMLNGSVTEITGQGR